MRMRATLFIATMLATSPATASPFEIADIARIEELSDPVFAPDGKTLVYAVSAAGKKDQARSDLWQVGWDGKGQRNLTHSDDRSEWQPAFSANGRTLAFLSDGGKDEDTQLWTMTSGGGGARQVSHLPGGISDYSLSSDGSTAIVVAEVGSRVGSKADNPPPIVIDRFGFKEDGRDWLDDRRQHLFRVDLKTGKATQITSGDYDNLSPSLSPNGQSVAFVSSRCAEADRHICSDVYVIPVAGGEPRRISRNESGDMAPDWEAGRPQWSPDGQRLLWIQGGPEKDLAYTPFQPVWADVASGANHPVAQIDRWFYKPRWSADGQAILALVEQDRDTWLARIDPASGTLAYLTEGRRFAFDFAVAGNHVAVLDGDPEHPYALRSVGPDSRPLGTHNAWLGDRTFGETRDVAFSSPGGEIHGILTLPPGYKPGDRPPLILRLHGGPVYQFSHELQLDWQIYAARGYAVLGINPRGSSGRGRDFAFALYANWGTPDVADIRAGIDYVVAQGVVDGSRIGVGGWSYGGILTNYMIASEPRIKAAVAGAGMANFLGGYGADQYARDYEIELGKPWEAFDRWKRLSYPFYEVTRITAPTLYLCAEKDTNVPCIGSEQMYQALKSRGLPTRLVIYPGENHGLTVPSYLVDRMQRQVDWYDRYVK